MKTRKLLFLVASLAILASPLLAAPTNGSGYDGGQAVEKRIAGYFYNDGAYGGGEFTLGGPNMKLSNSTYASSTKGIGSYVNSFQTFCVETKENSSSPVDIWLSTQFLNNTPGSHSWKSGGGYNLSEGTAYLYYKFAKGVLSNYEYTSGTDRENDAMQLQHAIWYLQNQPATVNSGYDGPDKTLLGADALAWVEEAEAAISDGSWSGIGNVRILQMYVGDIATQDMLYVVPAPGAILLAGIGTSLVGWLRRRKAI